jgi:adenylate cyclase
MTAAAVVCGSCGTELPPNSKFCNECGAAVASATIPAEYKQVTVLFTDVVRSMDIAATVGAERLREIISELVERSAAVVKRYAGKATDDKSAENEGKIDQAKASLKDAGEKVKDVLSGD